MIALTVTNEIMVETVKNVCPSAKNVGCTFILSEVMFQSIREKLEEFYVKYDLDDILIRQDFETKLEEFGYKSLIQIFQSLTDKTNLSIEENAWWNGIFPMVLNEHNRQVQINSKKK